MLTNNNQSMLFILKTTFQQRERQLKLSFEAVWELFFADLNTQSDINTIGLVVYNQYNQI